MESLCMSSFELPRSVAASSLAVQGPKDEFQEQDWQKLHGLCQPSLGSHTVSPCCVLFIKAAQPGVSGKGQRLCLLTQGWQGCG